MARRKKLQPLVVDGYNVIFATPRYQALIDEETTGEPYLGHDAHVRSRAALISDVAAFASGSYRATIVFDGSGNVNPERLPLQVGGVELIFSLPGEQADEVIERLAGEARQRGEAITVSEVRRGEFNDYIRVSGRVVPMTTVQLSPLEGGVVKEIVAEEGAHVREGDIILILSNESLDMQILNAEADLAEKENILRNTMIQMEQQKLTLQQEKLQLQMEVRRKKRV